MNRAKLTLCICGGGSLAHAAAGVLAAGKKHRVNVLTRRPEAWQSQLEVEYLDEYYLVGELSRVSGQPSEVIPQADIVILCVPTYARPEILRNIRPFLAADAWVGSFPGFGGFGWVARDILGPDQRLFGLQRVPFVCHKIRYGEKVKITGIRPQHFVASLPTRSVNEIALILKESFNLWTVPMGNYLCACLSMSNSLLHPARIYSLFRNWSPDNGGTYDRQPFFYAEWNDEATDVFAALDAEVQACCSKVSLDMAYVKPLLQHYEVAFIEDLTAKIRSIRALRERKAPMIPTPRGYVPDLNSYYFTEDIPYGLVVVKAITLLAGTHAPMMDAILEWYQTLSGEEYLVDGLLQGDHVSRLPVPQNYGICDLDALVKFCSA